MPSLLCFPSVRRHAYQLLVTFALGLLASSALACSISLPEYASFDPQEYVFYGEVTGYVSMGRANCGEKEPDQCGAWGLKVTILEPVSMPRPDLKEAELYSFGLDSLCGVLPTPRATVEKTPLGTRLMVVAKYLSWNPVPALARLDASGHAGAIVTPIPQGEDPRRLRSEETDYRKDHRVNRVGGWLEFELRKELVRLEATPNLSGRKRVLARLAQAPLYSVHNSTPDGVFRGLLRRYVREAPAARVLLARRERFLQAKYQEIRRSYPPDEGTLLRPGSPEALFYQGMYMWTAIPQDAIPLFKRAGRGGFVAAHLMMGRVYEELATAAPPSGQSRYRRLAHAAFERAALQGKEQAEHGDPWAQLMLAATPEELRPWIPPLPTKEQEMLQCKAMRGTTRTYAYALNVLIWCPPGT